MRFENAVYTQDFREARSCISQAKAEICCAAGLPEWFCDEQIAGESPRVFTLESELKAGQYGAIRSLLRVLDGGAASKV